MRLTRTPWQIRIPRTPPASQNRSPLKFFSLVAALSIPFWLIGRATGLQLFPGLPVSSFSWVCPVTAAAILVYRENKAAGVIGLLERSFDYDRIRAIWYAPIILLMPGITLLAYGLMRWMGLPLPTSQLSLVTAVVILPAVFIAALGEELGWSGYAIDAMQSRWNALEAGILLGFVWAAWHYVPLLQAQRSVAWIAWWSLYTVASRVLIVSLYNNTGKSVLATALYHAIMNVCWLLFPNYGSHWDPRITGPLVAVAATVVTVVWGPRTLARQRNS
jgi:membrane protease YdiL (CAAX protease family)